MRVLVGLPLYHQNAVISFQRSNLLPESKAIDILPSSVSSHTGSKLASSFESIYGCPNQIPFQSPALPSQFPGYPDYPIPIAVLFCNTNTETVSTIAFQSDT
ncbi:hypothetical protein Acr_24g0015140 [Actinidia rufa]|uniref:Uncharacterized protein n=1 Tax=Actinidia rufa TaxID=165716 RepID=A0A7J0GXN7_9ERIC|nr:hypothetical protein Acr_24g0015140 [Actinidia rufa]